MLFRADSPIENTTPKRLNTIAVWQGMLSLTDGTDTAPVAGTRYYSSIFIPDNSAFTGIGFLIGSVGGTDNVIVELHNSKGALVATSALAGTLVGTTGTIQQVPFIAPLGVVPFGLYFVVVQFNGTTARFRTLAAGTSASQTVIADLIAGAFGTSAPFTPATGFTAGRGPIAFTY